MSCVNGVFCGEFLEVLHVNEKSFYYFLEVCNVHVEGIHVHGETIHVDGEVTLICMFFQDSLVCVSFLILLCAGIIHHNSLLQYVYEAGEGDVKLSDLTRGSLGVKLRLRQRLAA